MKGEEKGTPWLTAPVIITAIIAGVFVVYMLSGGRKSDQSALPLTQSQPQVESPNNSIMKSSSEVLNATGYVVAQRRAAVSSKATGRLKELLVVEGDVVKAGQLLGVLENDDLAALVKQEEANVDVLQAKVISAQAELEYATKQFNRLQTLYKKGSVADADFDEGQVRLQRAQAELTASKANLVLAEARLEKSQVDVSYTKIVAPFDGTVLTKNADVGEIVAPFGSSTNARAAIVTIADMNSLEVEADVSEANLTKVFVGQQAEIILDSLPAKPYRGVVSKIVPTVDRAKATVMTKIKFLELDKLVIPEMSAKVAFKLQN